MTKRCLLEGKQSDWCCIRWKIEIPARTFYKRLRDQEATSKHDLKRIIHDWAPSWICDELIENRISNWPRLCQDKVSTVTLSTSV